MAVNKVVFGASTVIDISDSTVTDDSQVANGLVYYRADGTRHVGTASGGGGGMLTFNGEARMDLGTGIIVVHLPSDTKSWLLSHISSPGVYCVAETKLYQDGQYLMTIGRAYVPFSNVGTNPVDETTTVLGEAITSADDTGYDTIVVSINLAADETESPSCAYLHENTTTGLTITKLSIVYDLTPIGS